jgi:hypothetical protein
VLHRGARYDARAMNCDDTRDSSHVAQFLLRILSS